MTEILQRMRQIIDHELPNARFLEAQALAIGAKCTAQITGMPRGTIQSSQVEKGAELLCAATEEIHSLETELKALQGTVSAKIISITQQAERLAMRIRYLTGCTEQETADTLGYSVRHVQRLLRSAEQQLQHDVALMSDNVGECRADVVAMSQPEEV